ncbi:LADA_0D12398g1_1 [Lachancea dasiensis]|uniref:LADA_0D12398g1_1 n=1 Tax=Lachancea dasiensis TaxID=1072105 RepID=A0A1G4J869_9SACH|nr:LADA_0D12398g1_1 [Lachancea dasiensis]
MTLEFYILGIFLLFQQCAVLAFPVTFDLSTGCKECLYVESASGSVISYYFAVQQGSDHKLDINYEIFSPDNGRKPAVSRHGEVQGEWSFKAKVDGEYGICFVALEANRVVDAEIVVNSERRRLADIRRPQERQGPSPLEHKVDSTLDLLEQQITVFESNIQRFGARCLRNHATMASIDSQIKMYALGGSLLTFGILLTQTRHLRRHLAMRTRGSESHVSVSSYVHQAC